MKKTVLDAGDECGLAKFLAHRGAQACLLAPAALLQDLAARAGTPGCPAVSRVDEIPADAKRVFAHDPDDEAGLLARLRAARPDLEVHGWTGLIPVLVADRRLPAPDIPCRRTASRWSARRAPAAPSCASCWRPAAWAPPANTCAGP
jgi:hypothetical protein